MASAELNKKIYGMGAVLGLVEHGSRNDELHCIVNRVTGKSSVGALTEYEAHKVISELKEYMKLSRLEENAPPPSNYSVMSEQQKKFGFRLLYRLINLDETPSEANARERMSGVIEKVIQKKPSQGGDVFYGLSEADGSKIIEALKRYVSTAVKKQKRSKNGHI